jgi:hypothetical protein
MISKYRPKIISGEILGTSLTLSLKQCIRNSVIVTGPLIVYLLPSTKATNEKFGNKCVKILKLWRSELSYAQNKNRGEKMRLLGMDTCPRLNDIMEINKVQYMYSKRAGVRFLNLRSFTVKELARLKSLIDLIFCKLHYGLGGNRLPTLSKQASFSEFIIDRYDVSV